MPANRDAASVGSRLAIEIGTTLQIDAPRALGRLKVQFVGLLADSCVIVTRPAAPFEIGDPLVARYLYRGSVFGFRTVVTGLMNYPVKLLVLAYPTMVEEQSIRNAPRLACLLPCQVEKVGSADADAASPDADVDSGANADPGATDAEARTDAAGPGEPNGTNGVITDISASGCRVVIPAAPAAATALHLDDAVILRFLGPADGKAFEVAGTIRRLTSDREHLDLGIAFDAPVEEPCGQIRAMLEVAQPSP